jgi:hypothetical protein
VPVWVVEFQTRGSVVHPVIPFQMAPSSVEDRRSTVPVGVVLSVPGGVTETVAV